MKYAVNEEGVSALTGLVRHLADSTTNIFEKTSDLQSTIDDKNDTLGPHKESLIKAIKDIYTSLKDALEPINSLSENIKEIAKAYQEIIDNDKFGGLSENGVTSAVTKTSTNGSQQSSHKGYIVDYQQQVSAVQEDIMTGSGKSISESDAKRMLAGVQSFTGTGSTRIRGAYNNPNADKRDAEAMKAIDDYITSAPKWKGRVFRGINVSTEIAEKILSGDSVDMLGPSSWSSDKSVAESFSDGYKDVSIVFELDENKSGASITHIGSWDGMEAEVTAPSGVQYHIDGVKKKIRNGIETIYVKVHE